MSIVEIPTEKIPEICNTLYTKISKNPGKSSIAIIIVILIIICCCCLLSSALGGFGFWYRGKSSLY